MKHKTVVFFLLLMSSYFLNLYLLLYRSEDKSVYILDLSSTFNTVETLSFVEAFKKGQYDWHYLVPFYGENIGHSDEELKVAKMMFDLDGNQRSKYYYFEYCSIVSDSCIFYDRNSCSSNLLCYWCSSNEICLSKITPSYSSLFVNNVGKICNEDIHWEYENKEVKIDNMWISYPFKLKGPQLSNIDNCIHFIPQYVVNLDTSLVIPTFFHFYKYLVSIYEQLEKFGLLEQPEKIQFVYSDKSKDMVSSFIHYFSAFSPHCPLHIESISKEICFLNPEIIKKENLENSLQLPEFLKQKFNIYDYSLSKEEKPLLCLIKRITKRFILNEHELLDVARKYGYNTIVLTLDSMPLLEQLTIFHQCSILVGIHGSGMTNSVFLRPNAILIQLLPFKVCNCNFMFEEYQEHIQYIEWRNMHEDSTVIHKHLISNEEWNKFETTRKQPCYSPSDYLFFKFWINQDTIVNKEEFEEIISSITLVE